MIECDNRLLKRFVDNGDHESFERLVRRHSRMVLGLCVSMLPNRQDAEDAFQNVFLLLSLKSPSLLNHQCIGGWLHEASLRTCLSLRRKLSRKREVNVENFHDSKGEDHWEQIAIQKDTEEIHREIAGLPAKYRNVIVLCHLEGMSRSQAANMLDTTTASVKSSLTRARKLLKSRLLRQGIATTGAFALTTCSVSSLAAKTNATETLIQTTLDACGVLSSSGSSAPVALSITSPATSLSMTGVVGAALATMVGVLFLGTGMNFWDTGSSQVTRHISMMEASVVPLELPVTLASMNVPNSIESQDPQEPEDEPQEPEDEPQEPELDPADEEPEEGSEFERPMMAAPGPAGAPPVAIVGDPMGEAIASLEKGDRARLGRVIGDIAQSVELSKAQRSRLELAAKGATKKLMESRKLASERLADLQNGRQEEELDRDAIRKEFGEILSQIGSPPPAEESQFWTKEIEKILTEEQFRIYSARVEARRESVKRSAISNFIATADAELLLSKESVQKLQEFLNDRYVAGGGQNPWDTQDALNIEDRETLTALLGESVMEAWSEDLDESISELIYR